MAFDSGLVNQGSLFYYTEEGQTPPLVGDGVTYSRALGWQSPEGNFYGQERWVRDWPSPVVWNGLDYMTLEPLGAVSSLAALELKVPPYRMPMPWEIWSVPRPNWPPVGMEIYDQRDKDYYFWDVDTQTFKLIQWYWTIEGEENLPRPGIAIGAAHVLMYYDIKVVWMGYAWQRYKHSMIENDEPWLHLPEGFLEYFVPDVRVMYMSRGQLSLLPVDGGSGKASVNGHDIYGGYETSVLSSCPTLELVNGSIVSGYLERNTEYWIYLANNESEDFSVVAQTGDGTHNATLAWDFRGKLFLSLTEPVDGFFGVDVGQNAILVGSINSDNTLYSAGGPYFKHELDISWVSRRASFVETFRDYSDFFMDYVGPDEIRFKREDGYYGMLYVPEELLYLGDGQSIYRTDPWITVDSSTDLPVYHEEDLSIDTDYYVYIINDIDAANFNEINPDTNRPWQVGDEDSEGNYDAVKDLRSKVVLCDKPHEHYRLTETFPLFYTRCLGHIRTDDNGRFIYSKDGSYIKSLVINPVHLRGLADVTIYPGTAQNVADTTKFRIAAKAATEGVVYVGGDDVFTKLPENIAVHTPASTDLIQTYDGDDIEDPLSDLNAVSTHHNTTMYVYMANSDACWGDYAGNTFFCFTAPTNGYLSKNYPGTGSRWLATVRTDNNGKFSGNWLLDSIGDTSPVIGTTLDLFYQVSDNVDLLNFLMGWTSNYDLGLDPYISDLWSDYSDLSNDLNNLWSNYSNISGIADSLESNVDSLYVELSYIDQDLSHIQSDINTLSNLNSALDTELSYMSGNVSALDVIISNMGSDISGISADIVMLESVNSRLGSDIIDMQSNLTDLRQVGSLLGSNVNDLEEDVSTLTGTHDSLYSSVSGMGVIISGISNTELSLYSNVSALQSNVSDLESFQSLFDSNVWALLSDVSQISSINSQLESTLSMVESYASDASEIQSLLQETESRLQSDYSYINNVYSLMQANVTDIIQDHQILMNLHWYLDVNESALREDYSNMSGLQVLMASNISDLFSDASALSDIASLLSEDASNISGWVTSLSNLHWSLSAHVSGLGSGLSDINSDLGLLTSNVDLLSEEVISAYGYLDSNVSNRFINVYSNLSNLSGDLSNVWSNYSNISADVSGLDVITSGLQSSTSLLSGHVVSLSNQISYLDTDISEASEYADSLSAQLSLMSGHLNTHSQLLGSLSVVDVNLASNIAQQSAYANSLSLGLSGLNSNLLRQSGYISNLSNTTSALNSATSLASQQQVSLSSSVSNLNSNIGVTSNLVNSLASYTSNISANVSLTSGNLNLLSGQLNALDSAYDTTSNLVGALSYNIATLNNHVSATSNNVISLSNITSNLNNNYLNLSGNIGSLSAITSDLSQRTSNLSQNYVSATNRVSLLESNYNVISGIQNSMDFTLSDLQSYTTDLSLRFSNISVLVNNIDSLTDSLESEASLLSGNLVTTGSHLSNLSGDIWSLDSYVSNIESGLNSGYIGTIPVLITYDWIGKRFKFEDQKGTGLPVILSYNTYNSVTLTPTETDTQVVFPNAGLINLQSSVSISLSGCNTTGVLYYLYLKAGTGAVVNVNGSISTDNYYFSTSPPTSIYTSLATRSTTGSDIHDSMLVGYVCCPTTSNALQGAWNVWSLVGETEKSWTFTYNLLSSGTTSVAFGVVKPYYSGSSTSCSLTTSSSSFTVRGGIHTVFYDSYMGSWYDLWMYDNYKTTLGTYTSGYWSFSHGSLYYSIYNYGACGNGIPRVGRVSLTISAYTFPSTSSAVTVGIPVTSELLDATYWPSCNSYYSQPSPYIATVEGAGSVVITRTPPNNIVIVR
jgi:archaellum component FlaC